ncbi:MAG: MFS transporter, partial [Microthrixaceae bacterium]|nr:MFS transporter [Microthrixaceae bacterium]
ELSGVFLFPIAAQALAAVLYLIGLRPDPLRLAQEIGAKRPSGAPVGAADRSGVRTGIVAVALSHAMMVAVMSMTPVHLVDHGATLTIVGLTISLHVAGMYALSPLWGWLSDRVGRVPVIATGQAVLLASLAMTSFGAESSGWVVAGLILLGLGWSASTVAGSALIAESADPLHRTRVQGRADLAMSAAGALGGGLAGPVLFVIGYAG